MMRNNVCMRLTQTQASHLTTTKLLHAKHLWPPVQLNTGVADAAAHSIQQPCPLCYKQGILSIFCRCY